MVGRRAIEHPWIFREARSLLDRGVEIASPTPEERIALCREHLVANVAQRGEPFGVHCTRGTWPATSRASTAPPRSGSSSTSATRSRGAWPSSTGRCPGTLPRRRPPTRSRPGPRSRRAHARSSPGGVPAVRASPTTPRTAARTASSRRPRSRRSSCTAPGVIVRSVTPSPVDTRHGSAGRARSNAKRPSPRPTSSPRSTPRTRLRPRNPRPG